MKLLAVALVSIFVVSRANGDCPSGYDEFNEHCYMVLPMDMYGLSTSYACENVGGGGKRASIHDAFTNNMAVNLGKKLKPDSCLWIGLEYNKMNETFAWDDGQTLSSGHSYINWARGYPQQPLPVFPFVYISTKRENLGMWMNDWTATCGVICEISKGSPLPYTEGPQQDFTVTMYHDRTGKPDVTRPPFPDRTEGPHQDFTMTPFHDQTVGPNHDFTLPHDGRTENPNHGFTWPPFNGRTEGPNHDFTLPHDGRTENPNHGFTWPPFNDRTEGPNYDYTLPPLGSSFGPNQDYTLPHDRRTVVPDFTWPPFNDRTGEPDIHITAQPSYGPNPDFTAAPSAGPHCPPQDYNGKGMIFSPDFPAPYPNDVSCTYVIHASSEASRILLLFDEVDTEQHSDLIFIYDGPVNDEPKVISGHQMKGEEKYLSSSNFVTIVFSTDRANNAAGWSAKFLSVN